MSAAALERLRLLLSAEGGLIATLLGPPLDGPAPPEDGGELRAVAAGPAALLAGSPRTEGRAAEYELVLETIYEGYLLHYGEPRVVRAREADLRLLVGDRLYAIGLALLVELGDTFAVAELADTITLSALAQGAGDPDLAGAVWDAGARAVGWGPSASHKRAKGLVAGGSPEAIEAMRTSSGALSAPS